MNEQRSRLKTERPKLGLFEASKLIAKEWKSIDEATRKKYQTQEEEDKRRYAKEKADSLAKSNGCVDSHK